MSAKRFHNVESAEKNMGFAQAVRTKDNKLYMSGMVSLNENFEPLHDGDMSGQINHVYTAIQAFLARFDLSFDNVIKESIFATDISALMENIGERRKFYKDGCLPAATWVEVRKLVMPELMIEIEVIAEFP